MLERLEEPINAELSDAEPMVLQGPPRGTNEAEEPTSSELPDAEPTVCEGPPTPAPCRAGP